MIVIKNRPSIDFFGRIHEPSHRKGDPVTKKGKKAEERAFAVVRRYFQHEATEQEARKALKDIQALIREKEADIKLRRKKLRSLN